MSQPFRSRLLHSAQTLLPIAIAGSVLSCAVDVAAQGMTSLETVPMPFPALEWRNIGPARTGTRIVDFAVVEQDPRVMYAAAAGGGAWKTTNGGTTWTPVFEKEATVAIGGIAVSQSDPAVVWIGTGEPNARNLRSASWGDGVYKSVDGGTTWRNMGLPLSQHIGRVLIHPTNPDIVWVSVVGSMWGNDDAKNAARGLYRTTDGGTTWTRSLSVGPQAGIVEVAMDPRDPDVLYAAAWHRERRDFRFFNTGPAGGIFRTKDGGASWTRLGAGLPTSDVGRIGLSVCRSQPDIVYAVIEGEDGGVFRTDDAGSTWERRAAQPRTSMYYGQIRCDPNDADRVFVLQTNIFLSEDGGRTFTTDMARNGVHVDHHALWIDPADSDRMVLGNDGGIYLSRDRGESWSHVSHLSTTQFYTVAVDMREPFYHVYGGTQDNNSLGGPSATRNTDGVVNDDWYVTVGGDGFMVAIDPVDPRVVYTESQYGGIVRFDAETGERKRIKPSDPPPGQPWRWNWNAPILISAHDHKTVYFGAQVLFRSPDRGDTWTVISPDLTRAIAIEPRYRISDYGTIRTIAESPLRADYLGVGTDDGLVQLSRDGGRTWTRLDRFPGVPERAQVVKLILSAHDEETVYAAMSAHEDDDFRPFVLESTDFGATWSSVAANLPDRGQVRGLAEHPRTAGLLFAGTETGVFMRHAEGRWFSLKNNLPTVAVHDLVVHPRANDLVIGTHGRGFWILDDITALEEHRPDKPEDVLLFRPRPAMQLNRFSRGRTALGQTFYAAPNPPDGAQLTYFVRPGVTGAPIGLEIADPMGNVVRRLEVPQGGEGGGVHRVVWDLRYDPVFVPRGAGRTVPGPWVLPGTYRVRLTAAGTVRERPLEVVADPLIAMAEEERRRWHDFQLGLTSLLGASRAVEANVGAIETAAGALVDSLRSRQAPEGLRSAGEAVVEAARELRAALGGGPGDASGTGPITALLSRLYSAVQAATSPATAEQRAQAERSERQVRDVLGRYDALVSRAVPEFSRTLDAAGFAWALPELRPVPAIRSLSSEGAASSRNR